MKTSLIAVLAGMSILLFSTLAMADGEGCDSKKKGAHGKDMSAETLKDFHKTHPWITQEELKAEQSTIKKDTAVKI